MIASYKGKVLKVWRIGDHAPYPDWIAQAFSKNYLVWKDDAHLKILTPALTSDWDGEEHYWGYGMYTVASIGDVIDMTNGKVISAEVFDRNYRTIGNW